MLTYREAKREFERAYFTELLGIPHRSYGQMKEMSRISDLGYEELRVKLIRLGLKAGRLPSRRVLRQERRAA